MRVLCFTVDVGKAKKQREEVQRRNKLWRMLRCKSKNVIKECSLPQVPPSRTLAEELRRPGNAMTYAHMD